MSMELHGYARMSTDGRDGVVEPWGGDPTETDPISLTSNHDGVHPQTIECKGAPALGHLHKSTCIGSLGATLQQAHFSVAQLIPNIKASWRPGALGATGGKSNT